MSAAPPIVPNHTFISSLEDRLALVDAARITLEKRAHFRREGKQRIVGAPERAALIALEIARLNPVLGAEWGLGALEQARGLGDSWIESIAAVSLGTALAAWGQFRSARVLLAPAAAWLESNTPQDKTLLIARWNLILANRRRSYDPNWIGKLLGISDQLFDAGLEPAALCCRVDTLDSACLEADLVTIASHIGRLESDLGRSGSNSEMGRLRLLQSAVCFTFSGDLEQGAAYLDEAETRLAEKNVLCGLTQTWLLRAAYYRLHEEYAESERWLDYAQGMAQQIQHDHHMSLALLLRGQLQCSQGLMSEALDSAAEAMRHAREPDLRLVFGEARRLTGLVHYEQGRYGLARHAYQRAMAMFDRLHYPVEVNVCRMRLGALARREGQFTEAAQSLAQSQTCFDTHQVFERRSEVRFQLGLTYATLGHYQLAIGHFEGCLSLLEASRQYAQMVKPITNLAHIYAACGEFAEAHHQLERASALAESVSDAAAVEQAEGDLALRLGQISTADDLYHLSMEKLRRLNQLTAAQQALLKIGVAYVQMNRADRGQEVIDTVDVERLPVSLRWGYHTLNARLAVSKNKPDRALAEYIHALKQISKVRHVLLEQDLIEHFARANQRVFMEALELALDTNMLRTALEIVELAAPRLSNESTQPSEDAMEIAQGAATRRLLSETHSDGWTVIRYAWLKKGPDRELIAFVLTDKGLECERIRLSADERLALKVCSDGLSSIRQEAYSNSAVSGAGSRQTGPDFLRTLFHALIPASVCSRLRQDGLLAIIPSEELFGLAFQALLDGDNPLIAKTQIIYAPSLASLNISLTTKRARNSSMCGLVLAQSAFEQPGYPALPFVEIEKKALLSGKYGQATEVSKSQLNRQALNAMGRSGEMADYDWLHVATHAYVNPTTHEYTGLLFGSDVIGGDDLAQWQLSESVVVIAACQSGMARWGQTNDIAGIARAILTAGARSVVASQWPVDDEGSSELMISFYDQFIRGMSVSSALAEAQRKAHAEGIPSYVWATFCLYGCP